MKPFICLLLALATTQVYAQQQKTNSAATEQPKLQYQQYVAQLQAGNTDIDYYAFRLSRLDHKIAEKDGEKLIKLEKKLAKKGEANDYRAVADIALEMLQFDHTHMRIYKYLAYSYQKLGDTALGNKYARIENGLMTSILKTGDGKSCATAFEVIDIYEEYHIIRSLGLRSKGQMLVHEEGKKCDMLNTVDSYGKEMPMYFGIDKFYKGFSGSKN